MSTNRARSTVAILGLLAFSMNGCGSDYPDTIPVRGTVTFDGGDCPAEGMLVFVPTAAAPGFSLRPATAKFGTDGAFAAKSWREGDGLMPGTYKIAVECWQVKPAPAQYIAGVSFVEARVMHPSTSGIELVVEPGSKAVDLNYDFHRVTETKTGLPSAALKPPKK